MRLTALAIGIVLHALIIIAAMPGFWLAAILSPYAERLTDYGKGQPWNGL